MALSFTSIALSLVVKVPAASLQNIAASPDVVSHERVSHELVTQVLAYEQQQKLGYYPALDYFIANDAIEPELVAALQNISWAVTSMVRNEIKLRLRPAFSNIKFETIQTFAYTMPNVRGNEANKAEILLEHYDVSRVKVNLIVSLIQKVADKKAAQSFAKNLAYRWLKASFDELTITSSTVIS